MIRLRIIIIVTLSIISCLSTYAQQWQELYDQSLEYYNSGNYTRCLQTAEEALKVVDSELSQLFTLKILSTASNEAGLYNQGIEYGLRERMIGSA